MSESLLQNEGGDNGGQEGGQNEGTPWAWNENLPGTGDAPEWFKADKYGSVADQAKAYSELEGRFGSFTGAPEEYAIPTAEAFADLELPDGLELNIDADDPLLKAFIPMALEMGLSQEGFEKMVGLYVKNQADDFLEGFTTADEQKALLGDNADERLNNVARWAKANMNEELYEKFESVLVSADVVEVVEHLIGKTRNAQIPDTGNVPAAPEWGMAYGNRPGAPAEGGAHG